MLHPVITIAEELPGYDKSKDTTLCEATRPHGAAPAPVVCAKCHSHNTKCEWVSCPKEQLQATGAICQRCGSLQEKEADKRTVFWRDGGTLPAVLEFQHKLFNALHACRINYSIKPKLIMGPAKSGRTSLLHAIVADLEKNDSAWKDAPILYFGDLSDEYSKEYDWAGSGMTTVHKFLGYDQVLNEVSKYSARDLTIIIDAEQIVLQEPDIYGRLEWDPNLKSVLSGYHRVNVVIALKTAHAFTEEGSPFYMKHDSVVSALQQLTGGLSPEPIGIFL